MKKILFAVFAAIAVCTANAQYVAKDGDKIAFMGDSITAFGNTSEGYIGLAMYAMERLGVKDLKKIPAGQSGNNSNHMVARFKPWVLDNKPNVVVINSGVNDVWTRTGKVNVTLETFKSNIVSMVERTQAAGAVPVLLTPTLVYEDVNNVFNTNLNHYVKCMYDIAAEYKISIGDACAAIREELKVQREKVKDDPKKRGANLVTVDGVHLNYAGNRAMAWGVLKGLGVKDEQRDEVERFWREMPMLPVTVYLTRDEYASFKDAVGKDKIGTHLRERMVENKILGIAETQESLNK